MQSSSGRDIAPIYSAAFVIVSLGLLTSFLPLPGLKLASLSTDFRWRQQIVEAFNTLRLKAGDRLFNTAVIGSDGWILWTGDESIPDLQHTNQISKRDLQHLQTELDALNVSLQQQGRTLVVVIPPDKYTVYGQYVPPEIPLLRHDSRLDEFESYMKANATVHVLDLRESLAQASRTQLTYYKEGTHWTDAGAYVAYTEILNALAPAYPVLHPHPLADFDRSYIVSTKDLPPIGLGQIQEGTWDLTPRFGAQTQTRSISSLLGGGALSLTTTSGSQGPSLLIFHDSFYNNGLSKMLAPHFSRVMAVQFTLPTDRAVWSIDWVRSQPSDIVVIELTERFLDALFPLFSNSQ